MRNRTAAKILDFLKVPLFFAGVFVGMLLLAGCGSGSGVQVPPAPPGLTAQGVAYVVTHNSKNINAYYLASRSGVMADHSKSPFRTSLQNPSPAVLHPSGNFLYVGDTIVGAIQVYSTNFTAGDLSTVEVTFMRDSLNWLTGMTITPNGKYLYAPPNTELHAFKILPHASLIPLPRFPLPFAGSSLQSAVIDFSGQYLYLTDGGASGRIFAYQINSDGSLTAVPGSPFAASAPLAPARFDHSGTFLYAADVVHHIYAFKKAGNGALASLVGFPISTPASTEPIALIFEPTNHFLYASLTPGDCL